MSDLVPFGKHKGKPVETLLNDREYLDWLLQQGWFQQKYGNIYQVVINNGMEPSETPEHNAMQIKFLEEEYRLKFAVCVHGPSILKHASNAVVKRIQSAYEQRKIDTDAKYADADAMEYSKKMDRYDEEIAEHKEVIERHKMAANCICAWNYYSSTTNNKNCLSTVHKKKNDGDILSRYGGTIPIPKPKPAPSDYQIFTAGKSGNFICHSTPIIEADNGIDVEYSISIGIKGRFYVRQDSILEPYIEKASSGSIESFEFKIECKPTVGDDYPSVLRQIKRSQAQYLLIRSYTGIGATREQFVRLFETQGIKVVFESDVDETRLPSFDRAIEG